MQRKKLFVLEYLVDELDMNLNNECFQGFLHSFVRQCVEDEENKDEDEIENNRMIMRFLAKASG